AGCRYAARCAKVTDKCRSDEPSLIGETANHLYSCWHPVDGPLAADEIDAAARAARAAQVAAGVEVVAPPAATTSDPVELVEDRPAASGTEGAPLLEVIDLVKEFPVTSGIMQRSVGAIHA